jgi:hypothetical protein
MSGWGELLKGPELDALAAVPEQPGKGNPVRHREVHARRPLNGEVKNVAKIPRRRCNWKVDSLSAARVAEKSFQDGHYGVRTFHLGTMKGPVQDR